MSTVFKDQQQAVNKLLLEITLIPYKKTVEIGVSCQQYSNNAVDDNRISNSNGITVKRNPLPDKQISNKDYFIDKNNKKCILNFYQTLQSLLKVSLGNDVFVFTKGEKKQITHKTNVESRNAG